jgi:Fe2+ or Zn2+ uptake regulation protein
MTQPRRAVIEALVSVGDHPTADDLAEHVAATHPSVHKSTVYRTLDALTELGLVEHVHLGHGRAVYHLTGDTDLHLLCERCGAVAHISADLLDPTRSVIEQATGFVLEPGHFALPGVCAGCAARLD